MKLTAEQEAVLRFLRDVKHHTGISHLLTAFQIIMASPEEDPDDALAVLDATALLMMVIKDEELREHVAEYDPKTLDRCERLLGLHPSQRFVQVVYDPEYNGGSYSGVGHIDLIPWAKLQRVKRLSGVDNEAALMMLFRSGHPELIEANIVHFDLDLLKDINGDDFVEAA